MWNVLRAKQTRLSFNSKRTKATRLLEIIHTGVCGPINQATWGHQKIFCDIYKWFYKWLFYLLDGKFEVPIIKEYVAGVEVKWNMKLYALRCDIRDEYLSNNLQNWCKAKGTILDLTITYSLQLKGKGEWINHTLLEKTRGLLKNSKLSKDVGRNY